VHEKEMSRRFQNYAWLNHEPEKGKKQEINSNMTTAIPAATKIYPRPQGSPLQITLMEATYADLKAEYICSPFNTANNYTL